MDTGARRAERQEGGLVVRMGCDVWVCVGCASEWLGGWIVRK